MFEKEIEILSGKDTVRGCQYFEELSKESSKSNKYYEMTDELYPLLKSKNAYVRIRGFSLMCFQARWDKDNKLDKYIDEMMTLLNDDKPIVVRKCIEALHELLIYKDYSLKVENALNNIDLSKYRDTMAPLIQKDIEVLKKTI